MQLRSKRTSNSVQQNIFQHGDLILWNPREQPTSLRSTKLAPKLLGPYSVISQHKNDVTCEHVITFQKMIFHADRITPFIGSLYDARQTALLDRDEYIIREILAHRGTFQYKRHLQFLVNWEGYTNTSDTWEPWKELMHTKALHIYLRKVGMSIHIPKAHL